jgi:superfamily II DNA or RNA helicase
MLTPRDYQLDGIDAMRGAIRRGVRKICYQLPTGGGKTVVAGFMIQSAAARGLRVAWFAHRRELIMQPSAMLDRIGIPHGITMANHRRYDPNAQVQVLSIDTAVRRELPQFDLVIVDECHHARSDSYTEVIKKLNAKTVIGITATPCRLDGRGLGDIFEELVLGPTVQWLTDHKYLVPAETYSWPAPTDGIRIARGDYDQKQANDRMSQPQLVGNVIEHWLKRCADRETIVFASGIGHSRLLTKRFIDHGISAAHLDGNTPTDERDEIINRLRTGDLRVVCNYGVLTEGTDIPNVSAIVNCRMTQSDALWLQMAGRGLRSHPGKQNCIIHDHGGSARLHGPPEMPRQWTLTRTADIQRSKKTTLIPVDKVRVCPDCGRVHPREALVCPCGYQFKVAEIRESSGELQRVTAQEIVPASKRRSDYMRWMWEQENFKRRDGKPYSPGYAWAKYKSRYGMPPLSAWRTEYKMEKQSRG